MNNKIIRSICYFTKNPTAETRSIVDHTAQKISTIGYEIQTKRICSPDINNIISFEKSLNGAEYTLGVGTVPRQQITQTINVMEQGKNISCNVDITRSIELSDVEILLRIIRERPALTFNFAYVVNNPQSSPFFPSANYEKNGFSIGLQPTDLSEGCTSIQEWLNAMKTVWRELSDTFSSDPDFLGIDSSIAPLFTGQSSFINFVKRLGIDFNRSATTDTYLRITAFIKKENPKPVGLCGLMFPCLEDFDLADEYAKGNFPIERNIFLSLHSGLGVDTYPIGIDESPKRIFEVLSVIRSLSNKYTKPLSARFVSDGKAKIGDKTDFQNKYLKDVIVKAL